MAPKGYGVNHNLLLQLVQDFELQGEMSNKIRTLKWMKIASVYREKTGQVIPTKVLARNWCRIRVRMNGGQLPQGQGMLDRIKTEASERAQQSSSYSHGMDDEDSSGFVGTSGDHDLGMADFGDSEGGFDDFEGSHIDMEMRKEIQEKVIAQRKAAEIELEVAKIRLETVKYERELAIGKLNALKGAQESATNGQP